ncbi:hypothetical protein CDL12_03200 [Handroanthus impetiginosus]|uniref:NAC domain-containing protein n=1 Tax=Handroanthus impetiginosus TaxID=429701 RepID=A0A2G9I2U7_9LAMI|nr:hypothetical protein CDL12_03200 [Handroanthus impetiginosus]
MEERLVENDKSSTTDEVMLPGFRFHPTDEELVGFYLRRKIQQKPLSIELIKQLDIYKYDPWDLPKLATTGEKEWYFYCPRDRKYRNSTRPNRVTWAGFWKATGTDRPIYSEGSKCIGLKKSLVFYKGRAAKGIKTDWMMHEFRLPSVSDSVSSKKYLDKSIPPNEAWAICRIFKKPNSSTQRTLTHSWVSPPFNHITTSNTTNPSSITNLHFNSTNLITTANKTSSPLQFSFCNNIEQSSIASFSPMKPFHQMYTDTPDSAPPKRAINDASSLLLDMSTSILGESVRGSDNLDFSTLLDNGFSTENVQENLCHSEEGVLEKDQNAGELLDDQWGMMKSMGYYPYGFPFSLADAWRPNLAWDSPSPCPSELSTGYSTNKCHT